MGSIATHRAFTELPPRLFEKFALRAAHYDALALAESDPWRAKILGDISDLFLEMARHAATEETVIFISEGIRAANGVRPPFAWNHWLRALVSWAWKWR